MKEHKHINLACFVQPTCFANLYSQFGQFALKDRLLFLWKVGFLLLLCVSSLVAVKWLHLHRGSVLCFCCNKENVFSGSTI